MRDRTLVKICVYNDAFSLETISKNFHSIHSFYILKSDMQELKKHKVFIIKDMCSFAVLRLKGEFIEVELTWLSSSGGEILKGKREYVRLSYQYLLQILSKNGVYKQLSIPVVNKLKIDFKNSSNLKKVVENKLIRRKFSQFIGKHLNWSGYVTIELIDDFTPYGFLFTSYTQYGIDICGAIILHNQEDLAKAYYSMHT